MTGYTTSIYWILVHTSMEPAYTCSNGTPRCRDNFLTSRSYARLFRGSVTSCTTAFRSNQKQKQLLIDILTFTVCHLLCYYLPLLVAGESNPCSAPGTEGISPSLLPSNPLVSKFIRGLPIFQVGAGKSRITLLALSNTPSFSRKSAYTRLTCYQPMNCSESNLSPFDAAIKYASIALPLSYQFT
jgi:hypothetical protein